ncbi:MAG TPA: YeeE/YedE family protein [Burkholderiales bacterium]|jgi:uncharacterized membrane protein YedE/YeeE|nr:YeeE/YedE family protein [Burkholderiales bacterium]
MKRALVAFACGLLFGIGLIVSQMSNPARVIGFLDVAGRWDPSLAFVMAGAVAVFALLYRAALRRRAPLLDERFFVPESTQIDANLVSGAAIFGVGWGLSGFCPGPAVVSAGFGDPRVWAFLAAVIAGMVIFRWVLGRKPD